MNNAYYNYDTNSHDQKNHIIIEHQYLLSQMSKIRNKETNKVKQQIEQTNNDFLTMKTIMDNKDILVSELGEILAKPVSDKDLTQLLYNHINYAELIEEYIAIMVNTKQKLDKCITILQQTISNTQPILEIHISGQKIGKISNVDYVSTYDKEQNKHILQFDLKYISSKKIIIIDETKRQITFQMVHDGGMSIVYNVRFDLSTIDDSSGNCIVKGTYTTSKQ